MTWTPRQLSAVRCIARQFDDERFSGGGTPPPPGGTLFRALFNTVPTTGTTPATSYIPELDPAGFGIVLANPPTNNEMLIDNAIDRVDLTVKSSMVWFLNNYTNTAFMRFDLWQKLPAVPEAAKIFLLLQDLDTTDPDPNNWTVNDAVLGIIQEKTGTGVAQLLIFDFPGGGSPTILAAPVDLPGAVPDGTAVEFSYNAGTVTLTVGATSVSAASSLVISSFDQGVMISDAELVIQECWQIDTLETDVT